MKRLGIGLFSASSGLVAGAATYYVLATVLQFSPVGAQGGAIISTLIVGLGFALFLSQLSRGLRGNLIVTLVAMPLLFGGFLACGLLWSVLGVLLGGG